MENVVKTKTASEMVGVAPKTVRKWVKQFDIPCQRNENGHYLFTQESIQVLTDIRNEKMEEHPYFLSPRSYTEHGVSSGREAFDKKLDELFSRLDALEQKVSRKADEVVTYQVLQHRKEIDDISTRLDHIAAHVKDKETGKTGHPGVQEATEAVAGQEIRKRGVLSFFSL